MTSAVVTKTLTDGRTAAITRHVPDGTERTVTHWDVTIDGQPYTSGCLHIRPGGGQAIGTGKVIGVTPEDAETLKAVLAAEKAARQESPRTRYAVLVADAELAAGARTAAAEHAADTGEGWDEVARTQDALDEACEALDAFKAAHPDLAAEREAARQADVDEAVQRAMRG